MLLPYALGCSLSGIHAVRIGAGFFLLALPFLGFADQPQEPSVAREAGRAVYEFGQGVGQAALQPLADSAQRLRGEWITVDPRPVLLIASRKRTE